MRLTAVVSPLSCATILAFTAFACATQTPSATTATQASQSPNTAQTSSSVTAAAPNAVISTTTTPALTPVCTSGTADMNIVITSSVGPLGGTPPAITNKLYSMNIDDQRTYDYVPTLNANYVAFLAALKPALLRWPSGYYSQTYQFTTTGTGTGALTPDMIDGFMNLCYAVGAKPLMGINIESGTAANAALLVQFMNKTRNYGVTWWQIGNEPDVDGLTTTQNPNTYVASFQAFQTAMRAVDSNIKFVGGEVYTGADVMGTYNLPDWMTPIVQATAAAPMDAIDWHYYPLDSSQTSTTSSAVPSVAHALQEDASDWPPAGLDFASIIFPHLKTLKKTYAPNAELWVDEFAEDSGVSNGSGISDRVVGALWAADALGRFAEQGADAVFRFIFKAGAEHKYSLIDENYLPRPEYYTYWLYAQQFGDHMVQATSDAQSVVAAHASTKAADGTLRVILVNKTTTAQKAHVTLGDYVPKQVHRYQLIGQQATDTSILLNNSTLTSSNVIRGADAIASVATTDACASTVMSLPALSVTLLIYSAN